MTGSRHDHPLELVMPIR
jgi:hypothetical protein